MRIGILGSTELWTQSGEHLPRGGPRRRALLARLAVDAGRIVPVERLVDDLHEGDAPDNGANALQSQVSRIRSALRAAGDQHILESHPAGYRLALSPDDIDALRFERLAAAGRSALAEGDPHRTATLLEEALTLWRGEALHDIGDPPFAVGRVQRLNETWLSASEDLHTARLNIGGAESQVTPLLTLVARHPLREPLRGLAMRALAAAGRQAEALTVFEEGRCLISEELGADPSPELVELHLEILRGTTASTTAHAQDPGSTDSDPTVAPHQPVLRSVPTPLTRFIGAGDEFADLTSLLATERLITLTGPSGVGKTRRAVEAAARASGSVCVAELASAETESEVVAVVLNALDIRTGGLGSQAGGRPSDTPDDPTARLVAALSETPTLLVFDNCEHVLPSVAQLANRLLISCPALRILATSQEHLGLTGEVVRPVTPLTVPPVGCSAAAAIDFSAVRLFADRAGAVSPGFRVDDTTVEDVISICRTLDGLPLAIELAAARLRAFPLRDVTERLSDRFAVLTRGNRGAHPKHQTLRAAVAWSWELLGETEQRLARRFSVFSGGATLATVRSVCGNGADVADTLADLTEKSFLQSVDGRFRMLETLRTFAAEQLEEAGEAELIRSTHATHFLAFATEGERHLRGAEQAAWLAKLFPEQENLHSALRWSVEHDRPTGLRLIAAATLHVWIRGQRHEWNIVALSLLRQLGDVPAPGLEEEYVLCVLNAMAGGSGGESLAGQRLEQAADIVDGLAHPLRWPVLTLLWPTFYGSSHGEVPNLWHFVDASLASPEPWTRAVALVVRGYIHMHIAKPADAEPDLRIGTDRLRALGDQWGQIQGLSGLATLHAGQGSPESTLTLTSTALELADTIDAVEDTGELLCLRGEAFARLGRVDDSYQAYQRATMFGRHAGSREVLVWARTGMARNARLRGDLTEARRLCDLADESNTGSWISGPAWRRGLRVLVERYRITEAEHGVRVAAERYAATLSVENSAPHILACVGAGEVLASAVALTDPERAAFVLGITFASRGVMEVTDEDGRTTANTIKDALDEAAFQTAFTTGATMPREDVFPAIVAATATLAG